MFLPLFLRNLPSLLSQMFSPLTFPRFSISISPFLVYFVPMAHPVPASLEISFMVFLSLCHSLNPAHQITSLSPSNHSASPGWWMLLDKITLQIHDLQAQWTFYPQISPSPIPLNRGMLHSCHSPQTIKTASSCLMFRGNFCFLFSEKIKAVRQELPQLAPSPPKELLEFPHILTSCLSGTNVPPPFETDPSHLYAHLLDISPFSSSWRPGFIPSLLPLLSLIFDNSLCRLILPSQNMNVLECFPS